MKKNEIVKSSILFNQIIQEGKKESNKNYILYYLESGEEKPRFGIAVGKKLGNAVVRNKIKRQIRSIIDKNKMLFKKSFNYIIMVRKEYNDLKYNEKEKSLQELLGKVNNEN